MPPKKATVDPSYKEYDVSDDEDEYTDCSSSSDGGGGGTKVAHEDVYLKSLFSKKKKTVGYSMNHDDDDDEEKEEEDEGEGEIETEYDKGKCIKALKAMGEQGRHMLWEGVDYRTKWNDLKRAIENMFDARDPRTRFKKYKVKFYKGKEITGYDDLSYDESTVTFKMQGYFSLSLDDRCYPVESTKNEDVPENNPLKNDRSWRDSLLRIGWHHVVITPVIYERSVRTKIDSLSFGSTFYFETANREIFVESAPTANDETVAAMKIREDETSKNYGDENGSERVFLLGTDPDVDYSREGDRIKPRLYRIIVKFLGQRDNPSYHNAITRDRLLKFKEEDRKALGITLSELDDVQSKLKELDVRCDELGSGGNNDGDGAKDKMEVVFNSKGDVNVKKDEQSAKRRTQQKLDSFLVSTKKRPNESPVEEIDDRHKKRPKLVGFDEKKEEPGRSPILPSVTVPVTVSVLDAIPSVPSWVKTLERMLDRMDENGDFINKATTDTKLSNPNIKFCAMPAKNAMTVFLDYKSYVEQLTQKRFSDPLPSPPSALSSNGIREDPDHPFSNMRFRKALKTIQKVKNEFIIS